MHLVVHQLAKAYGYFWALKGLDFEIPGGECVALLGPNGAGKTTLLKLLAGLINPTAGDIKMDGTSLVRTPALLRSAVGLLAPSEHLYENLTVQENLSFFTALYKKNTASAGIHEALEKVGLQSWSGEYAGALSSGMKCRLSIAKWLLLDPGVLLLDEPYGVLDGGGVDLLEEFLKSQCHKGSVVVIASHHIARVLQICDRAIILHQGKKTFDEPRQQPWDSFQRAFGAFLPHGESWKS